MDEHPSPHDALFKAVFSSPENALGLLRAALPAKLADAIDPASLELEPGSFVDEALRSRHTDLLFRGKLGGRDALIYFLVEHQSDGDDLMPVRMLRYVSRIIDAWLERSPTHDRLPAVIPVVLFQGPRGWTGPRKLSDLIPLPPEIEPIARRHVVEVELIVVELSDRSRAALLALAAPPLARLALLFMKAALEPGGALSALVDPLETFASSSAIPPAPTRWSLSGAILSTSAASPGSR